MKTTVLIDACVKKEQIIKKSRILFTKQNYSIYFNNPAKINSRDVYVFQC